MAYKKKSSKTEDTPTRDELDKASGTGKDTENTKEDKDGDSSETDEDKLSDIDEDEVSRLTRNADKEEPSKEFKDRVLSYIKIDDLIRLKTEEIKELKEKKKPCEEYIIRYLEKAKGDHINIIDGKLIKNETETKAPLKLDIIKDSIKEEMTKQQIVVDPTKCDELINEMLERMEQKRPITKKVSIKRTFNKKNKKT